MATRQLIASINAKKCHVNTSDGSPTYEASTAYEAGTLVAYNGTSYVSIVDIEDSDTDTPDEAPDKWAIVPDALGTEGGEMSGLESRVTALENFDAAIPEGYLYMGRYDISDTVENGTYSDCLDTIIAHYKTLALSLEDDEMIMADEIVIVGNASLLVRANEATNAVGDINLVGSVVSSSDSMFIFWSGVLYSGSGTSTLQHLQYTQGTGNLTFNNDGPASSGASRTVKINYKKFKKVKTS